MTRGEHRWGREITKRRKQGDGRKEGRRVVLCDINEKKNDKVKGRVEGEGMKGGARRRETARQK